MALFFQTVFFSKSKANPRQIKAVSPLMQFLETYLESQLQNLLIASFMNISIKMLFQKHYFSGMLQTILLLPVT